MSTEQRNYTAILLHADPDRPGEYFPTKLLGCATTLAEVEQDIAKHHPQAKTLQVIWEDNWMYLPTVIPPDDRFDPFRYRPQQLQHALETCGNMLDDYIRGGRRGGSMSWDDLDSTHEILLITLPELAKANEESFKVEYPEEVEEERD